MLGIPSSSMPLTGQPNGMFGRMRQAVMSEAIPVTAINPVSQRTERDFRQTIEDSDEGLGNGGGRNRVLDDGARMRAGQSSAGRNSAFSTILDETGTPVEPSGPIPYTTMPNAAFVAQVIHQDFLGPGLHIEPWARAIDAYRRAGAQGGM